ncbi:hypothetical protein Q5692_36530, partial [Microcoleus sp. C2C3]|uniref:hypothetical protein n=1 Tax=unclassified Microcoleus TaxID=2642155 RepID=UPI002FD0DF81
MVARKKVKIRNWQGGIGKEEGERKKEVGLLRCCTILNKLFRIKTGIIINHKSHKSQKYACQK